MDWSGKFCLEMNSTVALPKKFQGRELSSSPAFKYAAQVENLTGDLKIWFSLILVRFLDPDPYPSKESRSGSGYALHQISVREAARGQEHGTQQRINHATI